MHRLFGGKKDIRNLKTFVNWCGESRGLNGAVKIKELKEDERPVKLLNDIQIRMLLEATEPYNKRQNSPYNIGDVSKILKKIKFFFVICTVMTRTNEICVKIVLKIATFHFSFKINPRINK